MKKLLITFSISLLATISLNAQDVDFGFTVGYFNADAKLDIQGDNIPLDAEGGFYGGLVLDLSLTNKFGVRPELVFVSVNESEALFLPVMAKFGIVNGLHLQAGPQFGISLESDIPDDFASFEFDLAVGLGIDFPVGVFVEARYAFQINNGYTGTEDITAKGRYITAGLGYKF